MPVRHGGWWPFSKTTEQKRHAAVGHGKQAYHWGKEYGKDKLGQAKSASKESYDKAKAQVEKELKDNEKAMKQAKVR
jgi:hypothetical protein